MKPERILLVGLGNPGRKYTQTRHNVGFMVLDHFSKTMGVTFCEKRCDALVGKTRWQGRQVVLAKPLTYMNHSGSAVSQLVQHLDIPLHHMLVVCDDVYLPLGSLRLRQSGSDGGNNGLCSIIHALQSKDFPRLRVGVGPEDQRHIEDLACYVLSAFEKKERKIIQSTMLLAQNVLEAFAANDTQKALDVLSHHKKNSMHEGSSLGNKQHTLRAKRANLKKEGDNLEEI